MPEDAEQSDWFDLKVQPHLAMLSAWLRSRFPSECDVDDIIQEACMRVLRARENSEIESPKAFLFATARNLAFNRVRQRALIQETSLAEIDGLGVLEADDEDISEIVARTEELEILTQAIQSLPPRCRQILTMRKVYGMPQKAIAAQLGIAEHTVEAQGTIGLRKIAEYFSHFERKGPSHRA
ncbi:MAG: sigma-70 family RNA polymerase sigma factor [Opitutus sp.]